MKFWASKILLRVGYPLKHCTAAQLHKSAQLLCINMEMMSLFTAVFKNTSHFQTLTSSSNLFNFFSNGNS